MDDPHSSLAVGEPSIEPLFANCYLSSYATFGLSERPQELEDLCSLLFSYITSTSTLPHDTYYTQSPSFDPQHALPLHSSRFGRLSRRCSPVNPAIFSPLRRRQPLTSSLSLRSRERRQVTSSLVGEPWTSAAGSSLTSDDGATTTTLATQPAQTSAGGCPAFTVTITRGA